MGQVNSVDVNELREAEIDEQREAFEASCKDVVARLNGCEPNWNAFCYDEVCYHNGYTDACWQSYIKGWKSKSVA